MNILNFSKTNNIFNANTIHYNKIIIFVTPIILFLRITLLIIRKIKIFITQIILFLRITLLIIRKIKIFITQIILFLLLIL
jgi:hypothetical protein